MAIEADYLLLMPDTVTVTPSTGNDAFGKRTFVGAVPVTFRARVQMKRTILKDAAGKELVSTGRAYLYGISTATIYDKITLPDASTPIILTINTDSDGVNPHHTTIFFGLER